MNDTTARVENDHMMLARLQGCGVYPCGILGAHEHTIYGRPVVTPKRCTCLCHEGLSSHVAACRCQATGGQSR